MRRQAPPARSLWQQPGREAEQGVQFGRVGEDPTQADIPLMSRKGITILRTGQKDHRRSRVTAAVGQRVGLGDETVQHHPAHVRQGYGQDEQVVGSGQSQLKGPLRRRRIIHLAVPEGGQGLPDHPTIGQALLGEENSGGRGAGGGKAQNIIIQMDEGWTCGVFWNSYQEASILLMVKTSRWPGQDSFSIF